MDEPASQLASDRGDVSATGQFCPAPDNRSRVGITPSPMFSDLRRVWPVAIRLPL